MRILTWNIHGASVWDRNERFPLIQEAIRIYQPDILCIQESFFPKSRKMLKSIASYQASYETNWFPPLTTRGGLVTLTRAKPIEVAYHPYRAQGNVFTEQKWDRLIGKGYLETMIEDSEKGPITIINTHKVCTYTEEIDAYLEAQAGQLLERLRERKERGEFLIVAGDFNFKRISKLYPQFRELFHDATEGLPDAVESLRHFHFFDYQTIDYIFVSHHRPFQAAYVPIKEGKYPSDHPGIVVDIK